MSYTIIYHPAVDQEDMPRIPVNIRRRILDAIGRRLSVEPAKYGQRLRKDLAGSWKLRVGDYRVVFQIVSKEVYILAIGHRSRIYNEALKRY